MYSKMQQIGEFFVSAFSGKAPEICFSDQTVTGEITLEYGCAPSLLVNTVPSAAEARHCPAKPKGRGGVAPGIRERESLGRTALNWGISPAEAHRLSGAAYFMARQRRQLWFFSMDNGVPEENAREVLDNLTRRIAIKQRQHSILQHWLAVWETLPCLHAHGIFTGGPKIVASIEASQLGEYFHFTRVYDLEGLVSYMAKERTSTADWPNYPFRGKRKKGSHQLPGGGDRVVLSAALKRDAIAAGFVDPWQRTYARRQQLGERKEYRPRPLTAKATRPIGQLEMFPALAKPAPRLRDYHGGALSPSAAVELEFRRKRLGLTQRQLGQVAAISQPQIANALHGRFGLSPSAAVRIKAALFAQERQAA